MDNYDNWIQVNADLNNADIDKHLRNALKGIALSNYCIFDRIEQMEKKLAE